MNAPTEKLHWWRADRRGKQGLYFSANCQPFEAHEIAGRGLSLKSNYRVVDLGMIARPDLVFSHSASARIGLEKQEMRFYHEPLTL